MPANKALGAQEEAKKDLVDKVNFWMHCNLHHILPSVADIYHKALTAPKTDNTERCKRSTYAQVTERSQRSKPKGKGCTYLPWKPNAGPTLTAVGRKFDTT